MKKRKGAWIVVMLASSIVLVFGAATARARAASTTATVEEGTVAERVVANAVVVPVDGIAEVRARSEGRVLRVLVKEGDAVTEGQLLAEVESDLQQSEAKRRAADVDAAVASASGVVAGARVEERATVEAEVKGAREELTLSRDKLTRLEKLVALGSATESALTETRQAVRIGEAKLEAAEARLRLARAGGRPEDVKAAKARVMATEAALAAALAELGRAKLVAPISGSVLARRIDPGDTTTIGPGTLAAFEIADPSRTELRLEVEEVDVDALEIDAELRVVRPGGAQLGTARVVRRAARMDRRTIGADDARVRADGMVRAAWATWSSPSKLPIGLRLEGWIERTPKRVDARLPRRAVSVRDGRAWVDVPFLLWSRPRPVQLGISDNSWIEVRGLTTGTTVLVRR
jgi:multidrug efflux pump subunit AcrA (membrane-fusion protein)